MVTEKAMWSKLRDGSWGVRVANTTIKIGDTVEAVRRDGKSQVVTIATIVGTGEKTTLCTIIPVARPSSTSNKRVCAECGRGGQLVRDLEDGMLKHYNCCDIPS